MLIVKEKFLSQAKTIFQETDVSMTKEDKRNLGTAHSWELLMGSRSWISLPNSSLPTSCTICCFYTWIDQQMNIPTMYHSWYWELLQLLEEVICQHFPPPNFHRPIPIQQQCQRTNGTSCPSWRAGNHKPFKKAATRHHISHKATAPLINLIIEQSKHYSIEAMNEQT